MRDWFRRVWQETDILVGGAFVVVALLVLLWLIGLPLLRG
jgi:hypothetical protein